MAEGPDPLQGQCRRKGGAGTVRGEMTVEARIRQSRLIEKMQKQEDYSERLGLENVSRFRGRKMERGNDSCWN